MLRNTRWVLLPALVVAGLIGAEPVSARDVRDEADLLRNPGKINQVVRDIEKRFGKEVLIEITPSVPSADAARVKAMSKSERDQYFSELAKTNFRKYKVKGIYILVNKDPTKLEIAVGAKTEEFFPREKSRELRNMMLAHFKRNDYDGGLLAGVEYVRDQFSKSIPGRAAAAPAPVNNTRSSPDAAKPMNLGGLICIGLVALVVIWLVIGLIRAMTAPRGGGYAGGGGYGGGGPGYAGGGGGGGFMTGLLGGLFGAVAGNWLYHNVFSGGGSSWGASQAYGAQPGSSPADTAEGEPTTKGGDWDDGGNAGGGDQADTGGGGGDWGGGGDTGGGGDWGGGGGGDWGGGGGDWGGGGGDFGGGGGGGDW